MDSVLGVLLGALIGSMGTLLSTWLSGHRADRSENSRRAFEASRATADGLRAERLTLFAQFLRASDDVVRVSHRPFVPPPTFFGPDGLDEDPSDEPLATRGSSKPDIAAQRELIAKSKAEKFARWRAAREDLRTLKEKITLISSMPVVSAAEDLTERVMHFDPWEPDAYADEWLAIAKLRTVFLAAARAELGLKQDA